VGQKQTSAEGTGMSAYTWRIQAISATPSNLTR
jgi:hypothetical protein